MRQWLLFLFSLRLSMSFSSLSLFICFLFVLLLSTEYHSIKFIWYSQNKNTNEKRTTKRNETEMSMIVFSGFFISFLFMCIIILCVMHSKIEFFHFISWFQKTSTKIVFKCYNCFIFIFYYFNIWFLYLFVYSKQYLY